MKRLSLCAVAGLGCLAALGTGGCAPREVQVYHKTSASADVAQTDATADDLRTLEHAPAAQSDACRAATARLVARHAPALLVAPEHAVQIVAGPGRRTRLVLRRGAGPGGVEPARFATLEPADDYVVTGAAPLSRTAGMGTPLVGTLQPMRPVSAPGPVPSEPVAGVSWAVTAVPSSARGAGGEHTLYLDLYDPHTTGRLTAPGPAGRQPLAADYTTPNALTFQKFRGQNRGLLGALRSDSYFPASGLYPTELPTTEKTPLVLVHGLISDPTDFHVLSTALTANAEVRRRYQVWVFYYPSSLPVVYSAMQLREDLAQFIHQLDPAGTHPALHRAVLVGHSMGGLLCRLAVSDGGDRYYHHFFRQPVEELRVTAADRALVRQAFYYRASPDVAQVVFISTPHHGSALARGFPGNLARLLVRVPTAVLGRIRPVVANNRAALAPGVSLKPGSSLDSLSPRDPVIAAINDLPIRPGVRLHSILGDRGRGGPPEKSSDGVVRYASSHLPQAESERIVPAGHTGALERPETAAEVTRILLAPDPATAGRP